MSSASLQEMQNSVIEQTKDLCHIQDHITRVIANLDIDETCFTGYEDPSNARYDLDAVIQMFLYMYARDFNQSELARRLRGAAYVYVRFGLKQPPCQQTISHNWRNRFTVEQRRAIKDTAKRIREICAEHDVIDGGEPALDPSDFVDDGGLPEKQIRRAVELATDLAFEEFTADRGPNITYELQAYFERQGYLNMADAGTTTKSRRFARVSKRGNVPHGSSHNRTMKKVADPTRQTKLWDFNNGTDIPWWKRIRNAVLPAFHKGVENQLDEIAGRDRTGIREPVIAAIDITHWNFWASPFKDEDDIERGEDPVELERDDYVREVYPKEDYPTMVSGLKESHERGYQFATITIIAQDTPIVLGIEPVRNYRSWEHPDKDEVELTSKLDLVSGLLDQAQQHVDIHKVFCDRGFDVHGVQDLLDRNNIQYVIGKQTRSTADYENVEEVADSVYDHRVEHAYLHYEGRKQEVSIIYLSGDDPDDEEGYSLFTVNGHVSPDRAQALTRQYRRRWRIENEYKTIKKHFLPTVATTDYRNRFLYFVIGVILYNIWRLANFVLRDELDVDLGDSPPIQAGEIVELVGFCLFDPGD